jgi:hypothetical protein
MGFPFSIIEDFFRTIAILALFGILYLIGQGILNLIWKPIDKIQEKKNQKKDKSTKNLTKTKPKKISQTKKKRSSSKSKSKNEDIEWINPVNIYKNK